MLVRCTVIIRQMQSLYVLSGCLDEGLLTLAVNGLYPGRSQLIRRFRQYTGQTPIQFKNRIIVKRARYYLENTDYSVSQIAEVLRFENVYYFSAMFKKQTGLSPTQYKSRAAMKGIPPPPIQK